MSKETIEELIVDLKEKGFEGKQLEADLWEMEVLGAPVFTIMHEQLFDDEKMTYKLKFAKVVPDSSGHTLVGLNATHRMPVDISNTESISIDLEQLDADMASQPWPQSPAPDTEDHPALARSSGTILDRLNALYHSHEPNSLQVRNELMYKHWPEEIYSKFSTTEYRNLKAAYEHSYDFKEEELAGMTAQLAYHIISERLDSLYDKISILHIEECADIDIREILQRELRHNPDEFMLRQEFNFQDCSLTVLIPVTKIEGWYHLDTYQLSVRQFPQIIHGVFNGVDSAYLEQKMAVINWNDTASLFTLTGEEEPIPYRDVSLIEEELFRLESHPEGKKIGEMLRLKFHADADFFQDFISDDAWKLLEQLPESAFYFPVEIDIPVAVNLLLGSPVMPNISPEMRSDKDTWLKMTQNKQSELSLDSIKGISKKDLVEMVSTLPAGIGEKETIAAGLFNGQRRMFQSENGEKYMVKLSPSADTLLLFNRDGKPVPYNFKLDPDWKPGQEQATKRQQQLKTENKPKGNRKVPGKRF